MARDYKKTVLRRVAFTVLFFIITGTLSFGESRQNDFILKQKRFINELYSRGRYFDCIAETRRLLNLKIDQKDRYKYRYFIEGNYFLGGQYKTVISNIRSIENSNSNLPCIILQSQSYLRLELLDESLDTLKQIDYPEINESGRLDLFLRRVEVLLHGSRYDGALSEMMIAEKYIHNFFDINEMKHDTLKYKEIAGKSKWLSVSLSAIVPGAGQVYSGRFMDGMISFITVLGSMCGAYYFHEKDDRPVFFTFSFFASLFYAGNLYGAYNAAKRVNREQDYNYRTGLLKKYIPHYSPMDYLDHQGTF